MSSKQGRPSTGAQAGEDEGFEPIPFRMHPRVFAALGADLVTNDVVAVIELVKNSYDAFAHNVWIRFGVDDQEASYLEVEDDGLGMDRTILEDVWCMVATPFKSVNPNTVIGKRVRRVAGEKGLGRLSAARLGSRLQVLTQTRSSECLEVKVDWEEISKQSELTGCSALCRIYRDHSPFQKSG